MGVGIGRASYVAFGMQTAFRTPQTSLITASHQRQGSIFTHRSVQNPSSTTSQIMPRADQLWKTMGLVDFDASFEYIANDTGFLPLFTAALGKRIKSAGPAPFTHDYVMVDPFVDGGTDTATDFYNHALTIREIVSDGTNSISPRVVQDIAINRLVLTMEANERLRFQVSGTGQKHASSTAPAFSQITGTVPAWNHAYAGANSGLYFGVANPPTTAMICKRAVITLDNNLLFEPSLGSASGEELHVPARAGWPSWAADFEMWAEDAATGTDMVSIFTDYAAETKQNFRVEYYVDANNSFEFIAGATNDIGVIRDPKPVYAGEGKVGFNFGLDFYPVAMTAATTDDIKIRQTTGT